MVENFSELLEQSLSEFKYKEGQIIKGTVLSIVNDTVVVDVGLKAEGRIPIKEFHSPGEEHSVKVGDKYDVYLEKLENKEGEALLSRERARKEDKNAKAIFDEMGNTLGAFLKDNFVDEFETNCIIFGGQISMASDLFINRIKYHLQNCKYLKKITKAKDIQFAALRGAAQLLLEK